MLSGMSKLFEYSIENIIPIIIAFFALAVSIITYHNQKKFNIKSVTPFLSLNLVDLNDRICIELENNGTGIALINNSRIISLEGGKIYTSLIEAVEDLITSDHIGHEKILERKIWKRYEESLISKAIAPASKKYLLELVCNDEDIITTLRELLSILEITIDYSDIYNIKQKPLSDDLQYFNRSNEFKF